jgi:hypothetical protein
LVYKYSLDRVNRFGIIWWGIVGWRSPNQLLEIGDIQDLRAQAFVLDIDVYGSWY